MKTMLLVIFFSAVISYFWSCRLRAALEKAHDSMDRERKRAIGLIEDLRALKDKHDVEDFMQKCLEQVVYIDSMFVWEKKNIEECKKLFMQLSKRLEISIKDPNFCHNFNKCLRENSLALSQKELNFSKIDLKSAG